MRISFFGLLTAPPAPASPSRGLVYRLRHWPELPPSLHRVDVLRALSVMSNRPVNRDWILKHSRLKPAALDQLLELLTTRGDVEVFDTSRFRAQAP